MSIPPREQFIRLLRWSERYTKTDMVYLASGGFWLNLMTLSVSLFSFILYVIFARHLPKEVYGTYQYLISLYAIGGVFTLTGMNYAIVRATAQGFEGTLRASIPIQLRWGLVPLIGTLCGAAYYYFIGDNAALALGLCFIAISTPLITTFNSYSAYLTGKKDFRSLFLYNLALNIPYYGSIALAAIYTENALIILAVNLAVNAAVCIFLYFRVIKQYSPNLRVDQNAIGYGKHLSVIGALTSIGQLDNVLAFHFLGAEALALYAFITAVPDRLLAFLKFVPSAALPKFAEKSEDQLRHTIGPKLVLLTAVGTATAAIYAFLAPLFFSVFFPNYAEAVPYSQVYALMMVSLAGSVSVSALIAQGRKSDLYILNATTPIVQIALQLFAVVLWGLWGLVAAKALSSILAGGIAWYLFLRKRTVSHEISSHV